MGASPLTEAEILSTWPEPRPRIQGMPTFYALRELTDYLKASAMKIATSLGGGQHGHLFLVLKPEAWAALVGPTDAPFIPPPVPDPVPFVPDGANNVELAEVRADWEEEVRTYGTYKNCMSALRTVILSAVDPIYVRALRNANTFYEHLSPRQILDHLFTAYGRLPPQEIVKIQEAMKQPWDPTQPFEVLINQIEEAVDTAQEANQPFSPEQVLNIAYVLVHATGVLGEACREWRKLPIGQQTWNRFKEHFIEATIQLRLDQEATSGHHGYANAMEVLNRLSEAAAADKFTVANLTAANSDLTAANTTMIAQLRDLTNELAALRTEVQTLKTQPPRARNDWRSRRQNERKPHATAYCWSHGALVGNGHNSTTCRTPKPGHQKDATRENKMGGSEAGCT